MNDQEIEKPYRVAVPQTVMCLLLAVLCVLGFFVGDLPVVLVATLTTLLAVCFALRRIREVLLCRPVMSLVFAAMVCFCCHAVFTSDEPWDTAPQREEDVPAWDGGDRRDPGGEKVVYSMLALMFGALVVMPWLPPGKRYYREMTRKISGSIRH